MSNSSRRGNARQRTSIWNERRVFTLFVSISLAVAAVWVVYVITTMHQYAEQGARDRAGTEATLVARMLQDRIGVRDTAVRAASREPGLVDVVRRAEQQATPAALSELKRQLVGIGTRVPHLEQVTVVDADGHLVGSSRLLREPHGSDFSGRDWYRGALHSDPYTSGAFIGAESGLRVAQTVATIRDDEGRVIAFMMIAGGTVMQTTVEALGVSGSTDVFVVDDSNTIVSGNGLRDDELRSINTIEGLRGSAQRRDEFLVRSGDFIAVQRPVSASTWRVLVRMRVSSAKEGFDHLARAILLTTTIAGLVWLVMAFLVIRGLTRAELADVRMADADKAREKLAAVDDARLRERARIAEELHDTSLQLMNASLMQLDTAYTLDERRHEPEAELERRKALGATRTQLRDAIRGMRRILLGLAAIDVDHLELRDAIELAARRATDAGGVELDIEIGDVNGLDEPVRSLVYRLASELVSNAVRHGQPSRVRLSIEVKDNLVHLDLFDDGIGFPVEVRSMADIPEREGLGLRTLARMHASGSITCEVRSSPGAGVEYRVTASVGLTEDDDERLRPDDLAVR